MSEELLLVADVVTSVKSSPQRSLGKMPTIAVMGHTGRYD